MLRIGHVTILNDSRKAILRAIYKLGGENKKRLSIEAGLCKSGSGMLTHLNYLEIGGYIERDPLRLTHAGLEVAKGYRDD
jgi:hypothetical protein